MITVLIGKSSVGKSYYAFKNYWHLPLVLEFDFIIKLHLKGGWSNAIYHNSKVLTPQFKNLFVATNREYLNDFAGKDIVIICNFTDFTLLDLILKGKKCKFIYVMPDSIETCRKMMNARKLHKNATLRWSEIKEHKKNCRAHFGEMEVIKISF